MTYLLTSKSCKQQNFTFTLAGLLLLIYRAPNICHISHSVLTSTVRSHKKELEVLLKGLMIYKILVSVKKWKYSVVNGTKRQGLLPLLILQEGRIWCQHPVNRELPYPTGMQIWTWQFIRSTFFKHSQHEPDFSACKLIRARTACRAEFRASWSQLVLLNSNEKPVTPSSTVHVCSLFV